MSVITLKISKPEHQQTFIGSAQAKVKFKGKVDPKYAGKLFYKWYSSCSKAPLGNTLDFEANPELTVGSHIICFTAKDQQLDDLKSLLAVKDSGMAGGQPIEGVLDPEPCVIHVFIAKMLWEQSVQDRINRKEIIVLNRKDIVLRAQAPLIWGCKKDKSTFYEPNPDYHNKKINRIQYCWKFVPSGAPPGRSSLIIKPAPKDVTFSFYAADKSTPNIVTPCVEYKGNLVGKIGMGKYRLTLRVEDLKDIKQGDENYVDVMIDDY